MKALAHITGGGIPGNLPRVLPDHMKARVDARRWTPPAIFGLIAKRGDVAPLELFDTFNMGIGMCAVLSSEFVEPAQRALSELGVRSTPIGTIEAAPGAGEASVILDGLEGLAA